MPDASFLVSSEKMRLQKVAAYRQDQRTCRHKVISPPVLETRDCQEAFAEIGCGSVTTGDVTNRYTHEGRGVFV